MYTRLKLRMLENVSYYLNKEYLSIKLCIKQKFFLLNLIYSVLWLILPLKKHFLSLQTGLLTLLEIEEVDPLETFIHVRLHPEVVFVYKN